MRHILIMTILVLFGAGSALAVPIDFRTDFVIPAGSSSYYYSTGGLTITAYPYATIYQDSTDGLGVISQAGYEYDEIEAREFLNLHFGESQYITSMLITDLFIEQSNDGQDWYQELGFYLMYDKADPNGFWTSMTAYEYTGTNGEYLVTMEPTLITDIWFRAPGLLYYSSDFGGYLQDHEFSVAMVDVQPVPEPSSLMLLGVGIVGLCVYRKRKGS